MTVHGREDGLPDGQVASAPPAQGLADQGLADQGLPAQGLADQALPGEGLPGGWRRPLAVVAHPDDESFGLGALLSTFVEQGAQPWVLCFTRGEASTLHGVDGDLGEIRAAELAAAAKVLGLAGVTLLDEADGHLGEAPAQRLSAAVLDAVRALDADGLLVFDTSGITGHPDHVAATRAALDAAAVAGLPVLAWLLPGEVAASLSAEFSVPFHGRPPEQIDGVVTVSRATQREAVLAHPSQAVPGSVLWRRLDLLGDREHVRWLSRGGDQPSAASSALP